MTPRERIKSIFNGKKPDKIPWFGDLDYWANSLIKDGKKLEGFIESDDYLAWHRDLGVGFYLQGYFPYKENYNFEVKEWNEGNRRYKKFITPKGDLQECWEYLPSSYTEGPIEHLVKETKDLEIMRYIYENVEYTPDYARAERRLEQVGDQGVVLVYTPKSPFMHLVALEAGIMAVTFAEMEAPDEFAETLAVMEKAHDKAARIAVDSPAEVLMIPENLSSEMVGPDYFEKYMRSYQEKWTSEIRNAGKHSFIHIDGTLQGLLKQEATVGFSVLESMTPAPVGDLAMEELSEFVENPNVILWGGIPGVYFTDAINDQDFETHVRKVLDIMKTESRFVLGVADQVPPNGLESRVRKVGELVEKYGSYE